MEDEKFVREREDSFRGKGFFGAENSVCLIQCKVPG